MCEWCPAHRIPPFEELIDDPPSPNVDVVETRRDYNHVAAALRVRAPAEADGTLMQVWEIADVTWGYPSNQPCRR